jgi:uncharacterized protein
MDLFTSDRDKSKAFYSALFGWDAEEAGPEFGNYITFSIDGRRVAGGMGKGEQDEIPDTWSVYLHTDDAERTAADVALHGGSIVVPPMAVGDLGVMAVFIDPSGAAIGTWQPGTHTGYEIHGEPGHPAWFELYTRDFQAAVAFYRDVFGWEVHSMGDTDEFRYSTLGDGPSAAAGVMDGSAFLPEGAPSHWAVYFTSADVDASVAKVVELGGVVLEQPMDTPYGRLAMVTDVTGAMFRIMQPNMDDAA